MARPVVRARTVARTAPPSKDKWTRGRAVLYLRRAILGPPPTRPKPKVPKRGDR